MVEKVRNNKSDSAQKKTTYEDIKLPKNMRQVGQVSDRKKIYVEDYVMTYIKQLAKKSYGTYQVAVLLGRNQVHDNIDTIFISGAVEVKDAELDDGKVFDNEAWTTIYADIKQYFKGVEVVGWYITRPGLSLELDDRIKKVHLDNFAGNDKVLLLYDSVEREEAFYLYNNKRLVKQSGYYIYYEKNEAMQTYMIDHKEKESVESGYVDQAGINIRNVLEHKNENKAKGKKSSIRYAVASVAALFLLVVAATMLSGVDLNGAKPVSNKKAAIVEATKEAEVVASEDAQTVVKVGDGTKVQSQDGALASINGGKETAAPSEKPKVTEKASSPDSSKTDKDVKNPDPKVVIDGTSPIPEKTEAPNNQSKETAAESEKVYEVVKGDTLGSISLKYFKSKGYIKKIMELNSLKDADKIYEGQKLKLPDK